MKWSRDNDRLKAAIGLATINAVINTPQKNWDKGSVLDAFSLDESDTFGMIGEFKPILSRVRSMTKNIYVFERGMPEGRDDLYPSNRIPHLLPKCDIVVISATTVINHTIDEIVSYCRNAEKVCMVGPSTCLCPDVFKKYNITLLAGSVVKNPDLILQIISQGGGTMAMKPAIEQVLMQI